MIENDTFSLGNTGLRLSALGLGAWQWGDIGFWGYGQSYTLDDVRAAFEASAGAGVNWVDTAEIYGLGASEKLFGEFRRNASFGSQIFIATKFFPYPWRWRRKTLSNALRGSLLRLGVERVDLYQTHWPHPPVPIETWMDGMADVVKEGLVRAIGVSNYSAEQTRRANDRLDKHGLALASNQIEYSLLHRQPEHDGTLATSRELGVTVIAYSPIAKGILGGKYTPDHLPPGLRARRYNRDLLARAQPLIGLMREIGQTHGAKTPPQVALNWLMRKSAVPIPGAKNARQAQENAGALGWRLTEAEVAALDAASDKV